MVTTLGLTIGKVSLKPTITTYHLTYLAMETSKFLFCFCSPKGMGVTCICLQCGRCEQNCHNFFGKTECKINLYEYYPLACVILRIICNFHVSQYTFLCKQSRFYWDAHIYVDNSIDKVTIFLFTCQRCHTSF